MARDGAAQRRRATASVLAGLLDETRLLQELWVQHDSMRADSVTEIIGYVDALAQRQGLDAATAKRLYTEFFKALKRPEAELPPDPWPSMLAIRPSAAVMPAAAAAVPLVVPVMQRVAAPAVTPVVAASAASVASPPAAAPPVPAAEPDHAAEAAAVFAALMRSMVNEIGRHHAEALDEIRRDALNLVAKSTAPAPLRSEFSSAWQRARKSDWRLKGNGPELSELTRVVYRALEMAFGKVGAEHILSRGLQAADAVPEAAEFSPKRLLAAL
jgi:hypothetical protein